MSSRSNGVMNELLTLLMISWVASSAACSRSLSRSATACRFDGLDLEEPGQLAGRLDEELGRGGEEGEKARVLGCEAKTHGAAPVDRGLVRGRCYGVEVTPTQPSIDPAFTPTRDDEGARPLLLPRAARRTGPTRGRGRDGPWRLLTRDAEQRVDLVGREMTRARRGSHHEVAHELDLVGECDIEQVTGPLIVGHHGSNLGVQLVIRAAKPRTRWDAACHVSYAVRAEVASGRERLSALGRS